MSDLNQKWNIFRGNTVNITITNFQANPSCKSRVFFPWRTNRRTYRHDETKQLGISFSNARINSNLSIKGCFSYYGLRIMKTALGPDAILSTSTVHGRYNLWTSLYLPFTFPLAASAKTHDTSKIHRCGQGTTHLLVPVEQDAHHVRTKRKSCSRTAFLWSCLILYLLLSLKKNLC